MVNESFCQNKAALIPTVCILVVIFAIGAVGNICTFLVIIKTKSLHTHANYYLLALACSDMALLFLACPLQIYDLITCGVSNDFMRFGYYIKEAYGFSSIIIICAFTAERWLAVRYPLRMNAKARNFCWAFVSISGLILTIITHLRICAFLQMEDAVDKMIFANKTDCPTVDCGETAFEFVRYIPHITLIIFMLCYVIPVIILSIMCYQIATSAHSTSCNAQTGCLRKTPNKMKKLLVAVVVSFLICWSPYQIEQILLVFFTVLPEEPLFDTIIDLSACCYYLNCAINPILYNMFSKNFRRALLHMISCGKPTAAAKANCSASLESNKTSTVTYSK